MRLESIGPIVVALAVLSLPALAGENPKEENVLVTFNVGTVEKGKETILKTYEMIVTADGEAVSMNTGARIPIPTTSFKVAEDGSVPSPITSFSYQHVGFSTRVRATITEDGRIFLRGQLEDSSLADKPEKLDRPFIQSMSQNLAVGLESGQPLRIHRTDETGTRSRFIQVQADRMEMGERVARR